MTIPVPNRMQSLPTLRGFVVPWFVAQVDGQYDFRVMDPEKLVRAVREKGCWLCGHPLGAFKVFVIGSMCAVNRTSSEPPCHRDCAEYAARVCPFLARPHDVRRDAGLPTDVALPAGQMLRRNPGVALLWTVRTYARWTPPGGGVLFDIGAPLECAWFAEGRTATRDEIVESMRTGLPALADAAMSDRHPELALHQLARSVARAYALVDTFHDRQLLQEAARA